METVIHVEGMMCTHCAARVEKASLAVPGAEEAKVRKDRYAAFARSLAEKK